MLNYLAPFPSFTPLPFLGGGQPLAAPALAPLLPAPTLDAGLGMWSDPTSSLIMSQLVQLLGSMMAPQALTDPFGMMGGLGGGMDVSGGMGGGGGAAPIGGGGGGSSVPAPVSTGGSSSGGGGSTGDDKALAGFVEDNLKGSPAGGQNLGDQFVAAGRKYDVDPLVLLAIGKHETGYGKLGVGIEKMLGVGAYDSNPDGATPFDGAKQQIWSGAKTFDNLRAKGGSNADAPIAEQLAAVNKAGWATDPNWHNGVGSHYNDIANDAKKAAPKAKPEPAAKTPKPAPAGQAPEPKTPPKQAA